MLASTIAVELGDIRRFASPRKLAGKTGLCPRVDQRGDRDLRGPLAKQAPKYLRWALAEATTHACTHPSYRDRYQQTKARIGKQRGAKVAQIDLARRLAEAIWHATGRSPARSARRSGDHRRWRSTYQATSAASRSARAALALRLVTAKRGTRLGVRNRRQ